MTSVSTKAGALQVTAERAHADARGRREVVPLDITVLAGGPGVEREVSLQSGRAVYDALLRLGHRATLCDIRPDDHSALERQADFVFIALHGEFGEDGTVQGLLDHRGLAYSGCGADASRLAMNKVDTKRRLQKAGLDTPAYEVVHGDNVEAVTANFELPAIIKPVASGSSVDMTIVRSEGDLRRALADVVERYGEALVERYVDGVELTVGVLGDEAMPVCEIQTNREFYDYQAKYVDDDTRYLFDIELPADLLRSVQDQSVVAHRALGCDVLSRVDWMVDRATLTPFVLEVNTIPGFTSHSLVPKAAERMGLTFEDLCQRIIELSLDKTN